MNNTINGKQSAISRFFELDKYNTTIKKELLAGFTTFATMSYVLVVIPLILSKSGLPRNQLTTAIILMSALTTGLMGTYAKRPFALAPGIAAVAMISYVLVGEMKIPIDIALGMVFISGIIFLLLTMTGLRRLVVKIIPPSIKYSIGAGVGMFIALIGLNSGKFLIAKPNNVLNLNLGSHETILAMVGLVIALALIAMKIRSYPIITIFLTTIIGIPMGITVLPDNLISVPADISDVVFRLDILGALKIEYIPFIFMFFMSDFFATLGTLLGVGAKAGYLDENGNMPGIDKCFLVDSSATVIGSAISMPIMTTYIESSAGVEAGGRSGMTSVTTALLFLISLLLLPIALLIPVVATAPVMIIIGTTMLGTLKHLDFNDTTQTVPALLMVIVTAFTFNIANGISIAILAYVIMMVASRRYKEVHIGLYILCIPLIYYFTIL